MVIFHSYVKLPEGNYESYYWEVNKGALVESSGNFFQEPGWSQCLSIPRLLDVASVLLLMVNTHKILIFLMIGRYNQLEEK